MKLCAETITVYNAYLDKQTDATAYKGTVLEGVHWFSSVQTSASDKGLNAANSISIRIPAEVAEGAGYVPPATYAGNGVTFQQGDIIIRAGVVLENPLPKDIKAAGEWVTILGVTDNRNAPNAKHFHITGA